VSEVFQLIAQGTSQRRCNAFAYYILLKHFVFSLPNPMRATPSIDQTSGASYYRFQEMQQTMHLVVLLLIWNW
jgi:hypothetical protein